MYVVKLTGTVRVSWLASVFVILVAGGGGGEGVKTLVKKCWYISYNKWV